MTAITKNGRELAWKLNPRIGTTYGIQGTCSLIYRHAVTYDRIQEAWCSVEMNERRTARLEAREAQLERRIADLVADLPHTDAGPWRVVFEGDPRGFTVRIVAPDRDHQQGYGNGVGPVGVYA